MPVEKPSRSPWTVPGLLLVALLLLTAPLSAAALSYSSVLREARANVEYSEDSSWGGSYSMHYPDSQASNARSGPVALQAASTYGYRGGVVSGRSSLESMIDGATISFEGHAQGNSDFYVQYSTDEFEDYYYEERVIGSASTHIDIRFEIEEWSRWSLSMALFGSVRTGADYGRAQLLRQFESGPDDVIFTHAIPRSLDIALSESGVLAPGRYRFVYAQKSGSGLNGQRVVGEFVVPEPGTALLLGLGLIGLASTRRGRHRGVAHA